MWMTRDDAHETVCPIMTNQLDATMGPPMACKTVRCQFWVLEDHANPNGRGRCVEVVKGAAQVQTQQAFTKLAEEMRQLPERMAIKFAQTFRRQ